MDEVSLWLTQKQNASMEEHGETSELRDREDDHDIKNDDKLEGNSSSNCDFSFFKDKACFLMFEDNGSHCKNMIGGIDHFTVVCLVAWPLNESEAGGDLVLIESSLLFSC